MTGFLLRRAGQSLIVLVIVSILTFLLIHLLPGSPAKAMLGLKATPAAIRAFNQENGFNRPVWYQYYVYVDHLVHGNLGFSYAENETVAQLVAARLPKSMLLVGLSVIVSVLVAVPLGLFEGERRGRAEDHALTGASYLLYSFPEFAIGLLLISFLAIDTHLLPPEAPSADSVSQILVDWRGLVLPVLSLSLVTIAIYSRFVRSSAIESLSQDYVRTARGKGASEWQVLRGHVARNSLIPMATLLGLSLPRILGGALVIETIFNYPGIGLLFFDAAGKYDYPVLMGLTLIGGVGVVIGNLLADIAYAVLDPRIRY